MDYPQVVGCVGHGDHLWRDAVGVIAEVDDKVCWGFGDGGIAAVTTVHKIAAGDTAGYVACLASQGPKRRRGDYYLGPLGTVGRRARPVARPGATALGLAGEVDRDQVLRLWQGHDPRSGEQLVRHAHGIHTAAVDGTFSTPKAVAIVLALGDQPTRDGVERAHKQAVQAACAHLESPAPSSAAASEARAGTGAPNGYYR